MEYGDIRHNRFIIQSELLNYKMAIQRYQERKDTWKNPNTCKKYLEIMETSAKLIGDAITLLKSNRVPLEEKLIARYELYKRIHATLID